MCSNAREEGGIPDCNVCRWRGGGMQRRRRRGNRRGARLKSKRVKCGAGKKGGER